MLGAAGRSFAPVLLVAYTRASWRSILYAVDECGYPDTLIASAAR